MLICCKASVLTTLQTICLQGQMQKHECRQEPWQVWSHSPSLTAHHPGWLLPPGVNTHPLCCAVSPRMREEHRGCPEGSEDTPPSGCTTPEAVRTHTKACCVLLGGEAKLGRSGSQTSKAACRCCLLSGACHRQQPHNRLPVQDYPEHMCIFTFHPNTVNRGKLTNVLTDINTA